MHFRMAQHHRSRQKSAHTVEHSWPQTLRKHTFVKKLQHPLTRPQQLSWQSTVHIHHLRCQQQKQTQLVPSRDSAAGQDLASAISRQKGGSKGATSVADNLALQMLAHPDLEGEPLKQLKTSDAFWAVSSFLIVLAATKCMLNKQTVCAPKAVLLKRLGATQRVYPSALQMRNWKLSS